MPELVGGREDGDEHVLLCFDITPWPQPEANPAIDSFMALLPSSGGVEDTSYYTTVHESPHSTRIVDGDGRDRDKRARLQLTT